MDNHADDTFACDLETRLEDFFEGAPSPQKPPRDTTGPAPSTDNENTILKNLKSSILAIDWEITDDVLNDFIHQIDALNESFKADKINLTFLKLLKSLGGYLLKHKSNAHPDTISRIMAVYAGMEASVSDDSLSESGREKRLIEEIKQFKQFKAQILAPVSTRPEPSRMENASPKTELGMDAVIKAIDEIRLFMASELSAIRREIEKLRSQNG
jgi:hypothetical protein